MRGRFIVFEGIDGAGKSTQISLLEKKLKSENRKVTITAEPTQSVTGGALRDALSGNYNRTSYELAAMFLADRIFHNVNKKTGIAESINKGFDVICDRYYYSSFAYQGMDTSLEWVMNMNLGCPEIMRPDLCIFLDLPPETSYRRMEAGRVSLDIFEEDPDLQANIRKKFFEVFDILKDRENIKIVNAARSIDEIFSDISEIVDKL